MKFSDISTLGDDRLGNILITGISCDSRKIRKDWVFVCISGSISDGHDYAKAAEENGASIIVCERDIGFKNQIIVEDSRSAYADMCAAYFGRPADKLKLIGITGTSGKTTVTYMTKSLLEQAGYKVGLIGTIMNIIDNQELPAKNTTPDAYELHSLLSLMLKAGCEYVVMEVSSHALDQKRVGGLHFTTAVFTNLSQDHLDYHGTMENYLDAKKILFKMCDTAIINIDDKYAQSIIDSCECNVITFSAKNDSADYTAKEIKFKPDGVSFEFVGNGVIGRVKLKMPGIFSVYNSMSAGLIGISLGMEFNSVVESLANVQGVKGRVEVVPNEKGITIIIDYAHTPDELENVISMLNEIKTGRMVTLFGCGGDRDRTKRPIMGEIVSRLSDFVIVTSDNPRTENPNQIINEILEGMKSVDTPYVVIENRRDAITYAIDNAQPNDVVLLAGKGHETYQILNTGTIHFDEREVILEALK